MRASRDLLIAKVLAPPPAAAGCGAPQRLRRHVPPGRQRPGSAGAGASARRLAGRERPRRRPRPHGPAMRRDRHLHRRAAGAQPGLPATDTADAADPGRAAHARASSPASSPQRLDRYTSSSTVKQAEEGDLVLPDQVLVAPGGRHLVVRAPSATGAGRALRRAPVSGHRPSIDVLFRSAAAGLPVAPPSA